MQINDTNPRQKNPKVPFLHKVALTTPPEGDLQGPACPAWTRRGHWGKEPAGRTGSGRVSTLPDSELLNYGGFLKNRRERFLFIKNSIICYYQEHSASQRPRPVSVTRLC